jgi:3-hydroxybutyryl-CoA dehydratase
MIVRAQNQEGIGVLKSTLQVCPPYAPKSITSNTMENF